jgi:hypothetical protein
VNLPDGQISDNAVQPRLQKYSASHSGRNSFITRAVPPERGAYRDRHERGAGCGGRGGVGRAWRSQGGFFEPVSDAAARRTNDASAYGEVVWSWHPLLMPSPRRRVSPTGPRQARSADDGGKRNSSPRRARRKPFQPLRAGMPGVSGVPVVTGSCAFYHSHARLRVHRHPAFPTPSTGGTICHASGRSCRGSAEACPPCRRHSGRLRRRVELSSAPFVIAMRRRQRPSIC